MRPIPAPEKPPVTLDDLRRLTAAEIWMSGHEAQCNGRHAAIGGRLLGIEDSIKDLTATAESTAGEVRGALSAYRTAQRISQGLWRVAIALMVLAGLFKDTPWISRLLEWSR